MFTLPQDLTTVEDLAALEQAAVEEFDALAAAEPEDLSDEQVDDMERLAGAVKAIRDEDSRRVTAAADRKSRVEAARATMTVVPDEKGDDDEDGKGTENTPADEEDEAPEAIAAAAAKTPRRTTSGSLVKKVVSRTPVTVPKSDRLTLTAAADIPGVSTGSQFDNMAAVASAFAARINAFPRGRAPRNDIFNRYGVCVIQKDFGGLSDKDIADPFELAETAAGESRLPGGSLVAAGGWCAPSETLYDLCENESLDGLIDLPEIGISRGGIRFTKGPDFSEIYDNVGFVMTETEAESGSFQKPCYEVPCPEFEEIRLDAMGFCVRAPLLTNAGWPELVQRVLRGVLVAHQHKVSAYLINQMVDIAGASTTTNGVAGIGLDLLGILEWVGESTRYRYRLGFNESLEVVAPRWLLPIIRQDLALRQGRDNPATVSDAEINQLFANRGVRIQWVYDWQPLVTAETTPPAVPATNPCLAVVPDEVDLLVYPAGTFVRGTADVISLDAVYDTASLQQNMYTAAFVEEGNLVANRCFDACAITVPVCVAGRVGGSLAADVCWTPVA